MEIIQKDNGREGVFKAVENGTEMGEMTYVWRGEERIVIDHTGVEPEFEGRGIGKQLFNKAVAFAREKQIKIVPICPFVVALFERMPETRDVL
jgi:predicted GNAT family acetyltransferase